MDVKFKIKTYFKIIGDFNPSDVGEMLGLAADKQWQKGDLRRPPNDTYNFSFLSCGTVVTKNNYYAEKQLEKTLALLQDKVAVLNGIRQQFNVKFVLSVVVKFYDVDEKPVLSPGAAVMEFCHATGAQLDYDYYFLFDTVAN